MNTEGTNWLEAAAQRGNEYDRMQQKLESAVDMLYECLQYAALRLDVLDNSESLLYSRIKDTLEGIAK
jgi:hypothetical protein